MTTKLNGVLSPLLDTSGTEISSADTALQNKRVALYFAAGWCPMCTSFEPALVQFRQAAQDSGKPVELVYVSSDRSAEDQAKRAANLGMKSVPYDQADDYKRKFKIWSGSEAVKLGFGRRSGVPALVVLDKSGDEIAFLAAESKGAKALSDWPLDDANGIWGE